MPILFCRDHSQVCTIIILLDNDSPPSYILHWKAFTAEKKDNLKFSLLARIFSSFTEYRF